MTDSYQSGTSFAARLGLRSLSAAVAVERYIGEPGYPGESQQVNATNAQVRGWLARLVVVGGGGSWFVMQFGSGMSTTNDLWGMATEPQQVPVPTAIARMVRRQFPRVGS